MRHTASQVKKSNATESHIAACRGRDEGTERWSRKSSNGILTSSHYELLAYFMMDCLGTHGALQKKEE